MTVETYSVKISNRKKKTNQKKEIDKIGKGKHYLLSLPVSGQDVVGGI